MRQGFLYLVAIIDWATRRVQSWRLSNTLTAGFCVEDPGGPSAAKRDMGFRHGVAAKISPIGA
jgi:hypothetical protein